MPLTAFLAQAIRRKETDNAPLSPFLLLLTASPVLAQEQQGRCAPWDQLRAQLASRFGEHQFGIGTLDPSGETGAITLQVNFWTGAFSIVSVHDNVGCIVTGGYNFVPVVAIPERGPGL